MKGKVSKSHEPGGGPGGAPGTSFSRRSSQDLVFPLFLLAEARLCVEKVALGTGMPTPAPGHRGARARPQGCPACSAEWTLGAAPHRDAEPPRGPLPARAPAETLPVTCPSGTPQLSPGPRDPGSHGERVGPGRAPGAHLCRAQQPSVKGLPRPAVYYLFLCTDELKGGINFFPQLPTADLSFSVFVTDTSRLS